MLFFSIITPCYNSSQTLWNTYESLCAQECRDFEWILVDDASNDDGKTRGLIEYIQAKAKFSIKALYLTENYFGSKSVFKGSSIATGKYVAILDHDDLLKSDALSKVKKYISEYQFSERFAGVCGRCVNESGLMIGEKFKDDILLTCESNIRFKHRMVSELFQFTKKEIIEEYFSEMKPGYTNGYVWARLSNKFNYLYVNDILRIYDTSLPTSYSNTRSQLVKFPAAKAEALKKTISSYRSYLIYNPFYSLRLLGSYLRHTILAQIPFLQAIREFDFCLKVCCIIVYPAALIKSISSAK
jgi:glycosyltransferase involved in cell wall biosynthesis